MLCAGNSTYKFSEKSKTNLKALVTSCHSQEIAEKKEAIKSSNRFSLSAISNEEQAKITDAVVEYVIEDDQPISLPEKASFRKLMGRVKPSWKPITRRRCCELSMFPTSQPTNTGF